MHFILIFLLFFILLKWILVCGMITIPLILFIILLFWGHKYYKIKRINLLINELTSKKHLDKLNKEQRLELAHAIEKSKTNDKAFSDYVKNSCTDFAIGWTIIDLGLVKAIRYGLGYMLLRKTFKDSLKKSKE